MNPNTANSNFFPIHLRLCILFTGWLLATTNALAAPSFTATLDRDTITHGETAHLVLSFDEVRPSQPPSVPSQPNLNVIYLGESRKFSVINGQASSTFSHNYQLVPTQPGEYLIPPIQVVVESKRLQTQPLTLRVLKSETPSASSNPLNRFAFLKLLLPKTNYFVGEVFPVEIQLYVTVAKDLQMPSLQNEGFVIGSIGQPTQTRTQLNNLVYNVVTFKTTASAVKTGTLKLGPAQISLVLLVENQRQRRDAFSDPFGMFSPRMQQHPVTLESETHSLEILPLPEEGRPPQFTGAIGNFSLAVNASPTNIGVGDPITLNIQVAGEGSLDALPFPPQENWKDFKLYPPTSKMEAADALGLTGIKTFEQVVIPQKASVTEIPSISFAYFDAKTAAYKSISHPAIPLSVRPNNAPAPQPIGGLDHAGSNSQTENQAQDLVHIKPHFGLLEPLRPAAPQQNWFWLLQILPLLMWGTALVCRKRREQLAQDPRLRRRLQVARLLRNGLQDLRRLAAENQTEPFFATMFRLLQEKLGERLDLPASAITESALDDPLRARHASEALIQELHALFALCNQARYAPQSTPQELNSIVPRVEAALQELDYLQPNPSYK